MADLSGDRVKTDEMPRASIVDGQVAEIIEPAGPDRIVGPAREEPDLSDLQKVVFNIEQRDGSQFSLIVERTQGMTLSMQTDHEGSYREIRDGNGVHVDTHFDGDQAWEFIIRLEKGDG